MDERVQSTIRFPKDFHKKLKVTAAERDVEIQEIVLAAVAQYLDEPLPQKAVAPEGQKFRSANQQAHDLLEEILNHGTKDQAGWITGNLRTFVDAIRLAQSPQKKRKVG